MLRKNLIWIRRDLRITNNELISTALRLSDLENTFEAIFIAEALECASPSQAWIIEQNVNVLARKLAELGIPLHCINMGPDDENYFQTLNKFYVKNQFQKLYYSRHAIDSAIKTSEKLSKFCLLNEQECLKGNYLFDLGSIKNSAGKAFLKFTPFLKEILHLLSKNEPSFDPLIIHKKILTDSVAINKPKLFQWPEKTRKVYWVDIGDDKIEQYLSDEFFSKISCYDKTRDIPSIEGTSRVSPYLNTGSLGIHALYKKLAVHEKTNNPYFFSIGAQSWLTELIWREFFHHLLWNFPQLYYRAPFKNWANQLPWNNDPKVFEAWSKGQTGFPLIDAAMRQLNETGWMHNRLRMLVASFLSKNLNQDWRLGEQYFLEHLVDADFASNNGGWQWACSIGVDATPYFRIFSPILQQKRFDPKGIYIYRHLSELASVPLSNLDNPYLWSKKMSKMPFNYPEQIVDIKDSRIAAIERYKLAQHA